jgi:tetratricopeptide (TPR) repeat protein
MKMTARVARVPSVLTTIEEESSIGRQKLELSAVRAALNERGIFHPSQKGTYKAMGDKCLVEGKYTSAINSNERGAFRPSQKRTYKAMGDKCLAEGKYTSAINSYVHTTEIPKLLKAVEAWRSNLAKTIEIADETFLKNTLEGFDSALTQYRTAQNKLTRMIEKLSGKCHTHGLQDDKEKVRGKIEEIQRTLFRSLNHCSLKKEAGLGQIGTIYSLYLRCGPGQSKEQKLIERIQRQIHDSLTHLHYISHPIDWWHPLHPTWDQVLIKKIDPKNKYNPCRPNFFSDEYVGLFQKHSDLRDGVISLTDEGFVTFLGEIQRHLVKFLVKEKPFRSIFDQKPPIFKFRKHDPITYDQMKKWLEDARSKGTIQDIPEILSGKPAQNLR